MGTQQELTTEQIEVLILIDEINNLKENGYKLGNIDATIAAQSPKLAPFIEKMRENIAKALMVDSGLISVKATTTEKLGFEGRKEGISAYCVCTIESVKND